MAAGLSLAPACRRGPGSPFITYYLAEHALSVRYPASWSTELAEQEGVSYRYFLPPGAPRDKPSFSVILVAGPLGDSLEDHAQGYLKGQRPASSKEESRPGARGRAYRFASADGATRYSLLLLQEESRVYGLFSQGEAARFEEQLAAVDEMEKSFTLERPSQYPEHRLDKAGFSVRVPPSWRATRNFSGGGTHLMQFSSPPLGADKNQTVHAFLTVSAEPLTGQAGVDGFYGATRQKLGEAYKVMSHSPWKDGYMDLMRLETPLAASRIKRFYRAEGARGYSLSFEARDDVFHRISRWCDMIAGTLKVGSEVGQP